MLRGGLTVLALAILALGLVLVVRDRRAPAEQHRTTTQLPDQDLAAYGSRIEVPREVLSTARQFIAAAVLRRDPQRAWRLAAPALKAGSTKRTGAEVLRELGALRR
jgi:hypothetical protein